MAETVRNIVPEGVRCIFLHQPETLGLRHAILCAEPAVGNEPVAVLLADDVMRGTLPTKQLVGAYTECHGTILSVMEVDLVDTDKYEIVKLDIAGGVAGLVQKPAQGQEPSRLASIGRYVHEPEIMEVHRKQPPDKGGEIQLADAINTSAAQGKVQTVPCAGQRYDCGAEPGYLEAVVDFTLNLPDYTASFRSIVNRKLSSENC